MSVAAVLGLNRHVGLQVYEWLVAAGDSPAGLILPREADDYARTAAADAERRGIPVFMWDERMAADPAAVIRQTGAALFISIHFPELLPEPWLSAFRCGCINLHPALLPWGKGWHTPTWAILEGSPFGVTIHHMTKELDGGDLIAQQDIVIRPEDTAHSLYSRALETELTLFQATWPLLRDGAVTAVPQDRTKGSSHRRGDLQDTVRRLDLDSFLPVRALLRRLRALTTDRWTEAAWFEENGRRYTVRVEIRPLDE